MDILTSFLSTISWKGIFMTEDKSLPFVVRIFRWWALLAIMIGGTGAIALGLILFANFVFKWW